MINIVDVLVDKFDMDYIFYIMVKFVLCIMIFLLVKMLVSDVWVNGIVLGVIFWLEYVGGDDENFR